MTVKTFACLLIILALQDTCFAGIFEMIANAQFTMANVRKCINTDCSLSPPLPAKSFSHQQYKRTYAQYPAYDGSKWIITFKARYTADVMLGSAPNNRQCGTSADINGRVEISVPVLLETKEQLLAHKQKTENEGQLEEPDNAHKDLVDVLEPLKAEILTKIMKTKTCGAQEATKLELKDVQLTKIEGDWNGTYAEYCCNDKFFYAYYSITVLTGYDDPQVVVDCPE